VENLPIKIEVTEWLNKFYSFITDKITEGMLDQEKHAIIPDQNGDFHPKKNLFIDEIPKIFKSEDFERFGISFKKEMIHSGIKNIPLNHSKTIDEVVKRINELFKNYKEKMKSSLCQPQNSTSFPKGNRFQHSSRFGTINKPAQSMAQKKAQEQTLKLAYFLISIVPRQKFTYIQRNMDLITFLKTFFPDQIQNLKKIDFPQKCLGKWKKSFKILSLYLISKSKNLKQYQIFHHIIEIIKQR
jgi:hypothetical protein